MSKVKLEKVEVDYTSDPLFAELGLHAKVEEYRGYHLAEKRAEAVAAGQKLLKDPLGVEIGEILEAVGVDSVNGINIDGAMFRTTRVPGDPDAKKLDPDKLLDAMLKIGKLDKVTIKRIMTAASVPAPRKGHILVTVKKDVE